MPHRNVRTRTIAPFALLFVTVLFFGCGSSKEAASSGTGDEGDLKRYEADFTPSDIDPEPSTRPDAHSEAPGTTAASDSAGNAQATIEQMDGFRVQVYSTPSIDEAKQKKAEVEGLFPGEWFYMEYDAPTYKIRAGNFLTRFDADRFVRQLIEKGFPDSWAVPSRVLKNPGVRPSIPIGPDPR